MALPSLMGFIVGGTPIVGFSSDVEHRLTAYSMS
jgi:hypothetical protein